MSITELNGVPTWVEGRGTGDAVLLLHGGFSHSGEFESSLWGLSDSFRVSAYDRRGHGRTADVGEWTRSTLVEDCVAVLERFVQSPAHIVGYSDGGLVAAGLTRARPDLVRSLTLISTALDPSDWVVLPPEPDPNDPLAGFPPQVIDGYAQLAPGGVESLPEVDRKVAALAGEAPPEPGFLADYPGRALVVTADDDLVSLESQVELYRRFRRGELAVIPGSSHDSPREKPDLVTRIVREFLAEPPPSTHIPIRRAG